MQRYVLVIVHGLKEPVPFQTLILVAVRIKHHHAICVLMDMVRVGAMGSVLGGKRSVLYTLTTLTNAKMIIFIAYFGLIAVNAI